MENARDKNEEDPLEFVRLLTDHQDALRALVYSFLPNHPDVKDLVQEINVVLWSRRSQFRLGTNFGAWASRVARNKLMNHHKKMRRAGWLVFDDDLVALMAEDSAMPESAALEAKRQALRHCLREISPQHRDLLLARYSSPAEIRHYARRTGRSRESLRVTLHRLRIALRRCIDQRLGLEGGAG